MPRDGHLPSHSLLLNQPTNAFELNDGMRDHSPQGEEAVEVQRCDRWASQFGRPTKSRQSKGQVEIHHLVGNGERGGMG